MAQSPLPHLPSNPLGELPSNPLGKPPTIGSRSGGGGRRRRYRTRSPLPNLTRKAPGRPPSEQAQAKQQERKVIHIHEHRNAEAATTSAPSASAEETERPSRPTAAERRETKHAGLRVRDREYIEGMPKEHQDRFDVLIGELTHRATQQHREGSRQLIDDMIHDERHQPRRILSPRARVKRRKASPRIDHAAAMAALEAEGADYAERHAAAQGETAQEAVRRGREEQARQQAEIDREEAEIKRKKQSGE